MKRLFLYLLCAALLAVSLSGCLASDKKLYAIYLLPDASGPQVFKEETPSVDMISDTSQSTKPASPAEVREVLHNKSLHEIHLDRQSTEQRNVYTSSDSSITCWFDPETDKLRMISAENWLDPQEAKSMDEDDYIDWIRQQVSEYYTEEWSEYTVSCRTEIQNSLTGTTEQTTKSGFVTTFDEYESAIAYTFTFTKYLGDYATTDMIQAYIRLDTGLTVLEFSAHTFDGAKPFDIDLELIQASIYQFITDYFTSTEYSYLMHSSMSTKLGYVEGRLAYICTVKIALLSIEDDDTFESTDVYQPVAVILN